MPHEAWIRAALATAQRFESGRRHLLCSLQSAVPGRRQRAAVPSRELSRSVRRWRVHPSSGARCRVATRVYVAEVVGLVESGEQQVSRADMLAGPARSSEAADVLLDVGAEGADLRAVELS